MSDTTSNPVDGEHRQPPQAPHLDRVHTFDQLFGPDKEVVCSFQPHDAAWYATREGVRVYPWIQFVKDGHYVDLNQNMRELWRPVSEILGDLENYSSLSDEELRREQNRLATIATAHIFETPEGGVSIFDQMLLGRNVTHLQSEAQVGLREVISNAFN